MAITLRAGVRGWQRASLACLFMGLATTGLMSMERTARSWPSQSGPSTRPALPPCQCRADMAVYELGATTCINGRLATCVLDQNVTNWRPGDESCAPAS
jgi:hypothetical protein